MPFKVTIERVATKPVKKAFRVKATEDYYAECKAKGMERTDEESEVYRSNTTKVMEDSMLEERTVLYEQTLEDIDVVSVIAAANKAKLQS